MVALATVNAPPEAMATDTKPGVNLLSPGALAAWDSNLGAIRDAAANSDIVITYQHYQVDADVETGAAVDTETLFQAASISKPVAAMAVLRAVQDGHFSLDEDINGILTSWRLDGGEFTRDRPVTPRMLTSHMSGLGDGFGFPGYDPGDPLPTTVQILNGEEPSNVGEVFMERPPMTARKYSGGGVTVMQLALSDALGRPFAVGFLIVQEGEGWYFSHGGGNWGFRALLKAHRAKGYDIAVMTNADRGGEVMVEIADRVARAYGWDSLDGPVTR